MAKLTLEKKRKLQDILGSISTPGEKRELQKIDTLKAEEIMKYFEGVETEHESKVDRLESSLEKILLSFEGYRKASSAHSRYLVETFGNFSEAMVKKIGELGGTLSTSYEKNKPINTAGVYKDMINQIGAVKKSIDDKPVPVWNWPQYASVGVRDTNFANVNPSIAPFNITAQYNEVTLTNYDGNGNVGTVSYYYNDGTNPANLLAVLQLTYDGSGNLIEAIRTQ